MSSRFRYIVTVTVVGVALAGAAAASSSCGLSCTDAGCDDEFNVSFTGDVPEDYRVVFEVPGEEPVTVPCDEFDCLAHASLKATPAEVRVKVLVDDVEIASETFSPEYRSVRPNGSGCPPVCEHANVTMEI